MEKLLNHQYVLAIEAEKKRIFGKYAKDSEKQSHKEKKKSQEKILKDKKAKEVSNEEL